VRDGNGAELTTSTRSPEDITKRLDEIIFQIREYWHKPVIGQPAHTAGNGDILIVAHGHILRALAMRWIGKTLSEGPTFILEAGGVGVLR
jgi:sedoheptulose-bisphosphatase